MSSNKNRSVVSGGIIFLLLVLWALPAFAQQEKGDKELQLQGLLIATFTGQGKGFAGQVFVNFGYFFTEQHEAGAGTNLSFSGKSFKPEVGLTVFYRYHFIRKNAKLYPYLGIDFFAASLTTAPRSESLFVRPNLGFKYFFKRNVAFDVNSGYGIAVKHPKEGSADTRFGISYLY